MRFITSTLLVCASLSSCYEDQDLGSGYYYLPDYEALDIGYPAKTALYKSLQKNVFSNVIAEGDVAVIRFNDKWIAFTQKDTMAPSTEKVSAYLINKKTDKLYGPYSKTAYNQNVLKEFALDVSFKWE